MGLHNVSTFALFESLVVHQSARTCRSGQSIRPVENSSLLRAFVVASDCHRCPSGCLAAGCLVPLGSWLNFLSRPRVSHTFFTSRKSSVSSVRWVSSVRYFFEKIRDFLRFSVFPHADSAQRQRCAFISSLWRRHRKPTHSLVVALKARLNRFTLHWEMNRKFIRR